MQGSTATTSIPPDQKASALHEVLESATFARAEQLRSFLRLVCEMEMAGRASAINEYLIGVEGLGRSVDFVPSTDGIVRSRAHALRQKLFEYYTKENPNAAVRIDLPKGSYVPKYVLRDEPEFAAALPLIEPEASPAPLASPAVKRWRILNLRDVAVGVLLASAVLFGLDRLFHSKANAPAIDPVIAEAWGPLAQGGADALIVLERPAHYIVRSLPVGSGLAGVLTVPPPAEIQDAHAKLSPLPPGHELRMSAVSSHRGGEVLGMAAVLKVLNAAGASVQIVPDQNAPLANLRGRNAMLFGDPNLAPIIGRLLSRGVFTVEYDKSVRDFVVRERGRKSETIRTFYPKEFPADIDEYPGIVTVLPSDGTEGGKRIILFAAGNSVGSQAAAEYFSSPRSLKALKELFRREKLDGFPRAYQVVVMGRSAGPSLLSFSYVAHRVLDASVF